MRALAHPTRLALLDHLHAVDQATATDQISVLSPADLERIDINLVGGDIYAGSCALDQNLLWRPLPSSPGHSTPVKDLWHIGASTHPGPGLGAGSGTMVAKRLLRRRLWR